MNKGCIGCKKVKCAKWIQTVHIVRYEVKGENVVVYYGLDGVELSAVVAPHQLGVLAARLGKTRVQILGEGSAG